MVNREKLKHCMLFFLEKINNVYLGRTKLMKLLYYVDFDHYEAYDKSVTSATYKKLPHGPVPAEAEKIINEMVKKQEVREFKTHLAGYRQKRLATLTAKFDPSKFGGGELEVMEKVAKDWENNSASEIEAASHKEAPWKATKDNGVIDYELANYRKASEEEPVDQFLSRSDKFRSYVNSL